MQIEIPDPNITIKVGDDTLLVDAMELEWFYDKILQDHKDEKDEVELTKKLTIVTKDWLDSLEGSALRNEKWQMSEAFAFLVKVPEVLEEFKKKLNLSSDSSPSTGTDSSKTSFRSPPSELPGESISAQPSLRSENLTSAPRRPPLPANT